MEIGDENWWFGRKAIETRWLGERVDAFFYSRKGVLDKVTRHRACNDHRQMSEN